MPKRVLYIGTGMGSSSVVKGIALYKATRRVDANTEFGFIVASEYARLLPQSCQKWLASMNGLAQIRKAIGEFEPDEIISYNDVGAEHALKEFSGKAWLIRRLYPPEMMKNFHINSERWQRIFAIEPGAKEQHDSYGVDVTEAPHIYSIFEDELIPREEARYQLLHAWNMRDTGKPLLLACHNADDPEEVTGLVQEAQRFGQHKYHVVGFSQNRHAGYISLPGAISRYSLGVDCLFAVAGPGTFWDWMRYKPQSAVYNFFTFGRVNDPMELRLKMDAEAWVGDGTNGAEVIMREVLGA